VIIIKITNKDGPVTEITVPEGSKIEVNDKTINADSKKPNPMRPGRCRRLTRTASAWSS